jgi:hypothetical protein
MLDTLEQAVIGSLGNKDCLPAGHDIANLFDLSNCVISR